MSNPILRVSRTTFSGRTHCDLSGNVMRSCSVALAPLSPRRASHFVDLRSIWKKEVFSTHKFDCDECTGLPFGVSHKTH